MERFFGDRPVTFWSSGTAALSKAISECAILSGTRAPEVILPAYGCPDLVSACLQASTVPRLVDVAPSCWSFDYSRLSDYVTPNTVALVAVNLLGVGDDAERLREFCNERGVPLIQDSAQFLPRTETGWPGDYVVLSFGRGKPLNLLHGGALVAPSGNAQCPSSVPARFTLKRWLLATRAAGLAFNMLTLPQLYGILSALPGTGLGNVVYEPLGEASMFPGAFSSVVNLAFDEYRLTPSYRRAIWAPLLEPLNAIGFEELRSPNGSSNAEPLRLALLAPDRERRDSLMASLNRAGLGPSRFYGASLPDVTGIPQVVKAQGPFSNAARLADRLLTLPTHSLVTPRAVRTALEILAD